MGQRTRGTGGTLKTRRQSRDSEVRRMRRICVRRGVPFGPTILWGEAKMDDMTEVAGLRGYKLARRGVLMTSLISGFTLATERVEAQAIHTDESGIEAG